MGAANEMTIHDNGGLLRQTRDRTASIGGQLPSSGLALHADFAIERAVDQGNAASTCSLALDGIRDLVWEWSTLLMSSRMREDLAAAAAASGIASPLHNASYHRHSRRLIPSPPLCIFNQCSACHVPSLSLSQNACVGGPTR